MRDESVPAPVRSGTGLAPEVRGILKAIDRMPEGACEAFDLVRTQGMAQAAAAQVLEVSVMTVQRRRSRGL